MNGHCVYLGLGSNLGNRKKNILDAVTKIQELIGTVECQSALFDSQPWGFSSENRFLNAVVRVRTTLTPRQVLTVSQQIERDMGRRKKMRLKGELPVYHDRIIDIDILLYDDITVDEPDLQIPHPLMHERDFVMIPLREVMES